LKIYVGNLSPSVGDEQLRAHFATHGAVNSASVVTDKFSGQSRGFGFVEMSDAEASAAIKALDGSSLDGSTLKVNEARPKAPGGGRFGGGGGGGGGRRPGGGNSFGGGRGGKRSY
jgi:RNA recognition motif-containing protein